MQILESPTSGTLSDHIATVGLHVWTSYFLIVRILLHMEICSWNLTMEFLKFLHPPVTSNSEDLNPCQKLSVLQFITATANELCELCASCLQGSSSPTIGVQIDWY